VPTHSTVWSQSGSTGSGKYSPLPTPDATTHTFCAPLASSSQNEVSATRYRHAEQTSTANTTDTANNAYVHGCSGR
jgi:hypothetical protein